MNGLVPLLLIGAVLLFIVLALQNVRPGRTAKLPVEAKLWIGVEKGPR